MENNERKVLLSLKDVCVKFNVRGRILTAIRNVSLDIYENESIAIVGESGSGKSVLTKTFAGMLDANGFISQGSIIFSDDEISKTEVQLTGINKRLFDSVLNKFNKDSALEAGAEEYLKLLDKKTEIAHKKALTDEEEEEFDQKAKALKDSIVETNNRILTLDKKNPDDVKEIKASEAKVRQMEEEQKQLAEKRLALIKQHTAEYEGNAALVAKDNEEVEQLTKLRDQKIASAVIGSEKLERNKILAYEVLLSIGRYPIKEKLRYVRILGKAFKEAMQAGEDLRNKAVLNRIFQTAAFYVEFKSFDEATQTIHGYAVIDCAHVKYTNDWQKIRGCRIATVFQDPMTSLNPVITIGKQIMTVILKHQKCSQEEARKRTIDIMSKVGIPDAEKRFNDYPFQYSGGMRQRIVIAIALSCQPKILICDEPTTALDVTIQAQIIRLIKDLQHELGFTTVYITHDLGVVANVAERVAVLYSGQIVELGTVEEIFYDPRHPYTWALLSSLPQLTEKNTDLFSIPGTPPSLYNKIVGDAFAPRNKYAMAIDLKEEPPMFKVTETHYAKTWLLDPRAPKIEAPKNIQNLHEKMAAIYHDFDE